MVNELVTKGNENTIIRNNRARYYGIKAMNFCKKYGPKLLSLSLLLYGGHRISHDIMEHGYDATADFGVTKFTLSRGSVK